MSPQRTFDEISHEITPFLLRALVSVGVCALSSRFASVRSLCRRLRRSGEHGRRTRGVGDRPHGNKRTWRQSCLGRGANKRECVVWR
eukprot:6212790-Pleurochrysis_carterae.AAC.3